VRLHWGFCGHPVLFRATRFAGAHGRARFHFAQIMASMGFWPFATLASGASASAALEAGLPA
jgi:hypothetical protein